MEKYYKYVASWFRTPEDEIIREITPMSELREKIQNVKRQIETETSEKTEMEKEFDRIDTEANSTEEKYNPAEQTIIEDEAAINELE